MKPKHDYKKYGIYPKGVHTMQTIKQIVIHVFVASLSALLATSVTFEITSFFLALFIWVVVFLVSFGYIGGVLLKDKFLQFTDLL